MIALSTKEEWDYTLADERGQDGATVFRLKPLALRDRIDVENLVSGHGPDRGFPIGTFNVTVLRGGVAGWSNLKDSDGKDVRFAIEARDGKMREDLIGRLPSAVCSELAMEIMSRSTMSAADRKN